MISDSFNPYFVFCDDFLTIRHHLRLHNINSVDCSEDECRALLLRHLFTGQCASSLERPDVDQGCASLWDEFDTSVSMMRGMFNLIRTSLSSERLTVIVSALGLHPPP